MTLSTDKKIAYAVRREQRLLRAKTATALLPLFFAYRDDLAIPLDKQLALAIPDAVRAADALLAEVDRTAPGELTQGATP